MQRLLPCLFVLGLLFLSACAPIQSPPAAVRPTEPTVPAAAASPTVFTVRGRPVTAADIQAQARSLRFEVQEMIDSIDATMRQSRGDGSLDLRDVIPADLLAVLEDPERTAYAAMGRAARAAVIADEAARRGLTVTGDDAESAFQKAVETYGERVLKPDLQTGQPVLDRPDDPLLALTEALAVEGMTIDDYRAYLAEQLLTLRVMAAVGPELVPDSTAQVRVREVTFFGAGGPEDFAHAQKFRDRWAVGEDVDALFKELLPQVVGLDFRTDDEFLTRGRDANWDAVVFSLQPGEISQPFTTTMGVHVVQLLERRDTPPADNQVMTIYGDVFWTWLDGAVARESLPDLATILALVPARGE